MSWHGSTKALVDKKPIVISGKMSPVRFNIMVVGECGNGKVCIISREIDFDNYF